MTVVGPSAPGQAVRRPAVAVLLPDLRAGGAERVNINLANELVARGHAVDMLLMRPTGGLLTLLDPRIRVVDLGAARIRGVFVPLVRYLKDSQPESLLACMWPLTVLAVAARVASRTRMRLVVAEHTTWSASARSGDGVHSFMLRATMRMLLGRADAVVAVSNGAADDLAAIANLPRDRVVAIYNPIVNASQVPASQESLDAVEWASGSHRRVLAVGTLKAVKDYGTLLMAFAKVRESVDAKLMILGEGEERGRLEALTMMLGLRGHVSLAGFVSKTAPYYRKADLHVLSSVAEGLPTVLVEALEQGVPVVSTDCPSGPREILDHGRFGALVPVGDVSALADGMLKSLGREHDRSALKARAADFSVDKATDAYLDLLLPGWRPASKLPGECK